MSLENTKENEAAETADSAATSAEQPTATEQANAADAGGAEVSTPGKSGVAPGVAPRSTGKKPLLAVLAVVVVLLAGGAFHFANHHGKPAPAASKTAAGTSSANVSQTNSWTGNAGTLNWGDAGNWTLGVPKNGQSLEFDAANITPPKPNFSAVMQNNLTNLSLDKITFKGSADGFGVVVKGNGVTVAKAIDFSVSTTSATAVSPSIDLGVPVTLAGDVIVSSSASSQSELNDINLGGNTLEFHASDKGSVSIFGALSGTGGVRVPDNAVASGAFLSFSEASPNFKGKVYIGAGDYVGVGNVSADLSGSSTDNAFGKSSIEIADGGTLGLFAAGTHSYTVLNDITMSGKGTGAAKDSTTGAYNGAITACITPGQEGCSEGVQIALTGKVTLSGNSQLGSQVGIDGASVAPKGTTATYTFSNLSAGSYTLTAVPDSQVVIKTGGSTASAATAFGKAAAAVFSAKPKASRPALPGWPASSALHDQLPL